MRDRAGKGGEKERPEANDLRPTVHCVLYLLVLFLAILIETGRKRFCHHGRHEAKTSRCQTKNRRQSTEEKITPHK